MSAVAPFTDEQLRLLINLEQQYDVWIEAERALAASPYGMKWKRISGRDYLYELSNREGDGRSLGRRNPETEAVFEQFKASKLVLTDRRDGAAKRLEETCRLCRALKLPLISSQAAKLLREADRRSLLGTSLFVIGTNAMPAYAVEACGRILGVPDETEDFDMSWVAERRSDEAAPFWSMLKAVDKTYTVNMERSFAARNASAYDVELLAAPSRAGSLGRYEKPQPLLLEEQEWLLNGRPVSRVVVARDGTPARIVAPDPRWFALQKLWLAQQTKRNALKRKKDELQGFALLDAVQECMPQYPLGASFETELPPELAPYFERWNSRSIGVPRPPEG